MYLVDDIFEPEMKATRDGYGEGLVWAGRKNKNVVALCCDLAESTRTSLFKEEFADRFLEMGVAEQNMMSVAAGMALLGKIPFVSSYAVFSPGRNWDQLRVSVCYSKANVKIAGAHAGVSVGADGATHQALEDIALTRVLPNLTVMAPADATQTKKAILAACQIVGPVYIRFGREKTAVFLRSDAPFETGKAQALRLGSDVSVIACGSQVYEALMAAEELKNEIDVEVINMHTIKPIDARAILKSARKTGRVVTAEEHQIIGGLGSAVAEVLAEKMDRGFRLARVGMRDSFGQSGEPGELLSFYGLGRAGIERAVREIMG